MQSDKSKALVDSITASIETLAAMTDETAKSETFKTWLRAVSRFHSYSFNNSLLILLQRPTASRVAGFNTWKALGRNVKKGAKGIAILAPCVGKRTVEDEGTGEKKATMKLYGFRVTHVFDVADTDGKELPELALHADHDGGEDLLPRLEAAARQMGIILEYRENTGSPYGWSEGGKIVVRATLSTVEKCGTLAHELAHEYLHWESNRRDGLTRSASLRPRLPLTPCLHSSVSSNIRKIIWQRGPRAPRASPHRFRRSAPPFITSWPRWMRRPRPKKSQHSSPASREP